MRASLIATALSGPRFRSSSPSGPSPLTVLTLVLDRGLLPNFLLFKTYSASSSESTSTSSAASDWRRATGPLATWRQWLKLHCMVRENKCRIGSRNSTIYVLLLLMKELLSFLFLLLFRSTDGNWQIKLVLSSYTFMNSGAMGFPGMFAFLHAIMVLQLISASCTADWNVVIAFRVHLCL